MILHMDAFDAYDTGVLPASELWDTASGVTIVADAGASGFTGDNAAYFDSSLNPVLRKAISPVAVAGVYTVTRGIRVRVLTLETTVTLLSLETALSSFVLKMTEWGSLELYQITGGNNLGLICQTSDGIIPISTGGCYIEIQFILDVTVPNPITLKVSDQFGNMNPVAQGSYLSHTLDAPATSIVFGGGASEDPATWYIDDVYTTDGVPAITPLNYQGSNVDNSSFLGNTHLTTFYMTADGATQSTGNTPWVPNFGSTVYTQINEHPPDEDTTYDSAAAADQMSTGLFESPESNPFGKQGCCAFAPIYGIGWLGRLRVDTGTGTVVPVVRRIAGGTFDTDIVEIGDEIDIDNTSYEYFLQVIERDATNNNQPFTFAVFFPAGVGVPGTVEFGIQRTA